MRPNLRSVVVVAFAAVALAVAYRWRSASAPSTAGTQSAPRDVRLLSPAEPDERGSGHEPPPAAECTTALILRIVDEAGQPIAGAAVTSEFPRANAQSDADGLVRLPLVLAQSTVVRRVKLRASAPGFASVSWTARMREDEHTDLGEIVLGLGGVVRGRVVDERGAAVEGASVRVVLGPPSDGDARFHGPLEFVAEGASGPTGEFEVAGVPFGAVRVWAGGGAWLWSSSAVLDVDVGAGAATKVADIALERSRGEHVLEFVVLDPERRPAGNAQVAVRALDAAGDEFEVTRADDAGRVLWLADAARRYEARAIDAAMMLRGASASGLAPGAGRIALELRPAAQLELAVFDEKRTPLERFAVRIECASPFEERRVLEFALDTQPSGVLPLPLPDERFALTVAVEGQRPVTRACADPDALGARLEFEVESPPRLRGMVTAPQAGLERVRVHLHAAIEPAGATACSARFAPEPAQTVECAADGTFEFDPALSGRFYLRAARPKLPDAVAGPFDVVPDARMPAVALTLHAGTGLILGELLVDPLLDAAGHEIRACRGDPWPHSTRTDDVGQFSFDNIAPGTWTIERLDSSGTVAEVSTVEVSPMGPTWIDLHLRAADIGLVRGRVTLGGRPAGTGTVQLHHPSRPGQALRDAALRDDGTFQLPAPMIGPATIRWQASERAWHMTAPVELRTGDVEWALEIPTARVQCRAQSMTLAGRPEFTWRAVRPDGGLAEGQLVFDDSGLAVLDAVPAGRWSIVRSAPEGRSLLREFELPADATFDFDL